jgi:deoxycytidylate deaminase
MLVLVDGTKIYGKNSQWTEVKECPRVTLGVSDYTPCDDVCNQITHAERDAIWKALSMGFDIEGSTMFLTGHWVCCDDCRRSMKVVGVKECYLLNSGDKIVNYVSFENDEELGIMDKEYSEALEAYKND